MSVHQQQQQRNHGKKRTWFLHRNVIISTVVIVALLITIAWILSILNVISSAWAAIITAIVTVAGVLFTFISAFPSLFHPDKPEQPEPQKKETETAQTHPSETIWNVPYPRNPFFTGREQLLKDLHHYLGQANTTALTQPPAITGLGGIGKTQVAIEYAHRYHDEYRYVLWVNAASLETLFEGFVSIARLVGLPGKDEPDQRIIVEATKHWLATHERWLLILDNADDLEMASEFLPTTGKGHLLLNTRAGATGSFAQNFPVERMSEGEGIFFLLRRAKILTTADASLTRVNQTDQRLARAIVQELDGFPLALDQAGAYLEETPSTLDSYLKSYRRHLELLGERGRDRYQHVPVATTWSLNFEEVERLNPSAAELLHFLAFLAPDAIPEDLIVAGASELGPQLEALATDETRLDQPLRTLNRFSLVQRNLDLHLLVIHRLVQAILKAHMNDEAQRLWAERTVCAVNRVFPEVDVDKVDVNTLLRCEKYLSHAQNCMNLIEDHKFVFSEAGRLLYETGRYLHARALYEQAEPLFQKALKIRERVLRAEHPDIADTLQDLAWLYLDQGRYKEAEPLYQRAFNIRCKELGAEDCKTAYTLQCLARVNKELAQYNQAESLHNNAQKILKQVSGDIDANTACILHYLAWFYKYLSQYTQSTQFFYAAQSEDLFEKALKIREEVLGVNDRNTAKTVHDLAWLNQDQCKYEKAEQGFLKALEIRERVLGAEHPDTASTLHALAWLYYTQGKYKQAEPRYQRALAIREQVLGAEHPDTASTLNDLARLYQDQGKYEQAEPLYQQALTIRKAALGTEHPDTAETLNNLALLYQDQGKYEQAETLYQQALTIWQKALGPEHPKMALLLENYATLLYQMKRNGEAARHEERAQAIRAKQTRR